MGAPTPTGNGCSLEYCYTNIFALTDICGIKWRKLCIDPLQTHIDPLEDPVLSSYSKCLQADILCVWRRVVKHSEARPTDLSYGKELWIFWYGDRPSVLDDILSPVLKEHEYGSWEKDSDLSYECRTLLFKALHNLIERCLLAKNFIRLGKWFVLPMDPNLGAEQSSNLSFCFHFFLHGESTVCASIEVKQHPAVMFLTTQHLNRSQENQTQLQVILAPYGLNGALTGVTYRDSDQSTRKHMDEWKQFYPVRTEEGKDTDINKLPNLVEVLVAGVRMKYPSCYVLLVDETHQRPHGGMGSDRQAGHHHHPGLVPGGPLTPPTSPEDAAMMGEVGLKMMGGGFQQRPPEPVSELTAKTCNMFSTKLMERVSQDSCITAGLTKRHSENQAEDTQSLFGSWDFAEPSSKSSCNCPRLRNSKSKTSAGIPGKPLEKKKSEKNLERQQSRLMRTSPFHRRAQTVDDFYQHDMDLFIPRAPPNSGSCVTNTSGAAGATGGTAATQGTTGAVGGSGNPGVLLQPGPAGATGPGVSEQGNVNNVSIESPGSNAPSPLEEPHNQVQMENTTSMDPTMPTLSPHPPLMKNGDSKDIGALKTGTLQQHGDSNANTCANNSSGNNNTNGLLPNSGSAALMNGVVAGDGGVNNLFHKPHTVMKMEGGSGGSCVGAFAWNQQEMMKGSAVNGWLQGQQRQADQKAFKRPCLPPVGGDKDELATDSLYNFDSVQNWSQYPLKKVCFSKTELLNGIQDPSHSFASNAGGQTLKPFKPPTPQPPAPDPYAFSDESSSTPATISRGSMRNSRDELFQRPSPFKEEEKCNTGDSFGFREERNNMDFVSLTSPPTTPGTQPLGGSLTREVDLRPQESDLDNLFETDSDSNDDAFIQENQAGLKSTEDTKNTKMPCTGQVDAIAPSELSRMYPTPPSLENNPAHSPMTSIADVAADSSTIMEGICLGNIKTESIQGTLTEEFSKEGKSVYRPDKKAQFPSSTKYAPLELHSSQLSPPPVLPEYKPSWTFHMPLMDKQHPPVRDYINLLSIENVPSIPSSTRMPSSAIEASPATFQNSVGQQRTPMSYDLQSPASNASSYLNKTPNSNLNHNIGTNNQIPEAHSLLVNIVLSDSILNLFKDHNFDSCNICVCNMTIKGSDLGLYIPNPTGEQEYKCTCGFSAVMNRKYGHNAGLFYEDEVDITGIRDERFEARKRSLLTLDCTKVDENGVKVGSVEDVSQMVMQLMLGQFSVPFPTCSTMSLLERLRHKTTTYPSSAVNVMQVQDGNEITYFALDQGRQAMEHCHPNKLEDSMLKTTCLHKWTYLQGSAQVPQNSLECVRLLKGLQPVLQDAIQNKRVTRLWEHTYKLQGPLTWIEFHLLAGRGSDENSEPQPIPSLLVGFDKDAATVSPYNLRYWDKNLLEPYGHRRDIAYVVVTPDNDFIMGQVKTFFKELSTSYEWSRLGKHCPISDKLRDGILRIGKSTFEKLGQQELDDWFKFIADEPVAAKLRLYALACKHYLAPFLAQQTDVKSLFASSNSSQRPSHHRPPDVPPAPENSSGHMEDRDGSQGESNVRDTHDDMQDSHDCPAIVIYIINPFTYAQDWDERTREERNRLAMIGLLRCFQEIVPKLPEVMQNNVYLQIVPLQTVLDARESGNQFQLLKNIAFSVFTSCRWNLAHNILGRSLTGFGPAAAADLLLKRKENGENVNIPYRLFNPPFVLAPIKDKQEQLAESCSEKRENSTILMCVYCLSEDQRFLLACCTDDRGETVETCMVNIEIPNRNRRKKTSARKIGLGKLWDFILGVISMSAKPCRVVIGRFGRIGHGELKGWSGLLSKKNIQRCSRRMREMCSQCSHQTNGDYPAIVSACLTSLEQQTSFDILPDSVKPEEKQSTPCPLQTPGDASCSHILVFPTSATVQANTNQIPLDSTGGIDLGGHNLEFGVDLSDTNIISDFENNTDDFGSLMDVFVSMTENSQPGSPRQDNPGSPGMLDLGGRNSPSKMNGISVMNSNLMVTDPQDDQPNLLQQPLAMGYYISTAQTGPLPRWFWSASPENELGTVKCFKSALHIHVSTNQDDSFMHSTRNSHPLDSNLTCDVLRFVLEKYNALSWLTFDPAKNDRRSCLPIHFTVLMQMYHATNAFI